MLGLKNIADTIFALVVCRGKQEMETDTQKFTSIKRRVVSRSGKKKTRAEIKGSVVNKANDDAFGSLRLTSRNVLAEKLN